MPTSSRLGIKIRLLRSEKLLSQEELTGRAGIKLMTLRDIETGRRQPKLTTIHKIGQALDVSPAERTALFFDEPDDQAQDVQANPNATYAHDRGGFQISAHSFFGIGRVTIAVPLRTIPGRIFPIISSEDDRARRQLAELLADLSLNVELFAIPPDGQWTPPAGDVIAICGPLNSRVTVEALTSDPVLAFDREQDTGLWTIRLRASGQRFVSPIDGPNWRRDHPDNSAQILPISGVCRIKAGRCF